MRAPGKGWLLSHLLDFTQFLETCQSGTWLSKQSLSPAPDEGTKLLQCKKHSPAMRLAMPEDISLHSYQCEHRSIELRGHTAPGYHKNRVWAL